jgi:hypothetical protein
MKHWRRDNDFTVRQSFSITSKLASVRLFLACGCIQKSTLISIKTTTTGSALDVERRFTHLLMSALMAIFLCSHVKDEASSPIDRP